MHLIPSRMRNRSSLLLLGFLCATLRSFGQATLPGAPEENGLQPASETFFINTSDTINNGSTESLGVAIARNGNVIIGWEDDGDALTDLEAVWTLFSRDGVSLTPDTEITTIDPDFAGQTLTSKFLSYFRANGSAVSGRTSWGPKIHANLFGDGIGMGATSFDLGKEVVELAPIQNTSGGENAGDFPSVQLLSNSGEPQGILSGLDEATAERAGDVRIGDWGFLSTSNIVIVGESRQTQDLVDVFGGPEPQNHVLVRIVDRTGAEVKPVQLVSDAPTKAEMWHGVGVTRNGFAIRFAGADGRARIRLFDNAGTPLSTNIDLATVATNEVLAAGGRGDGVGFHGNGNDAYAAVAAGVDGEGRRQVAVAVLNADGTLRWSRNVSDDLELGGDGRCDVGIDALGRVAVVYDDVAGTGGNARIILGRVFDPSGTPLGKTFYVSEKELPDAATLESRRPRVAFRNDTVAIVWESQNIEPGVRVVAGRLFVVPVKPGTIESVGLTRIVPDTPIINQELPALGNWEPYASVLGTNVFLIEGNAFAAGTSDMQRYVVAFQPAAGGPMKLGEAFFADNNTPYTNEINLSRQNGNPGRVAGDPRPGAIHFITGGEASPHGYDAFRFGNRWERGYDYSDPAGGLGIRYGTIQTFSLDPVSLTQMPLSLAQDSANGRLTSGAAASDQNTRFGGDLVGLSNGNFVSVVEDRSRVRNPDGNAAVATIFAPDGSVVKDSFLVANGDLWCNVAAYSGGFVVRVLGKLYFYDNSGTPQGEPVDQATSGESFDAGRGDGTRLAGHVNSPYVFLAGKVTSGSVIRVAAWDARTRAFVTATDVSEGGFRGDFDRAAIAVDALNRVVVSWVSRPDGYEQQQVAARVLRLDEATKTIVPLTSSFLPFINAATSGGIRSLQMSVAMTTRQILVAAKGEINLQNRPELGADSPAEINFYTVISHPAPENDPTPPASGGGDAVRLTVTRNGGMVTVTSDPQPLPAGYVLQLAPALTGPWAPQPGQNTPITVPIGTEGAVFLRAAKP